MQGVIQKPSLWNRIEQYIKKNHLAFLERKFSREVILPAFVNYSEIHSILVIRQHDQLGDFLLSTPVLRALREHFPKARIGVVVRDYFAEIVEHNPFVDEILVFHENGRDWTRQRIRRFWRQLRSGWDLAVVLNTVSHSLTSDLLAHFSRAKFILGSEHLVFAECSRNFFYNLVAPYWSEQRHQTERNLDIVRHIGVDTTDLSETMALSREERSDAMIALRELGLLQGKTVIGMHVGAGKLFNRWPVGRFGQLAQMLHDSKVAQVLLFGGPGEEQLVEHLCKYIQFDPIKIPPTSLRRLAAFFTCCDALVCNDTGVMHLAAAVGTPLVAIFGPTDPAEWKPPGKRFVALRDSTRKATDAIDVEQVYKALVDLLPGKLPPRHLLVERETRSQMLRRFDISESVLSRYVAVLENAVKENGE